MTMDSVLGDIADGSVHVRNGEIVAVGKEINGGGEKIDGTGIIVMPGLVETHWHMWNTLFRSFAGEARRLGRQPPPRHAWSYAIALPRAGRGSMCELEW